MPDPIATDDLYGPSNPPTPEGPPAQTGTPPVTLPIPIEETPEITEDVVTGQSVNVSAPQPQNPSPSPPTPAAPPQEPKSKTSFWTTLGALMLFVGLFGLGVWLSGYIRQYFPNGLTGLTGKQQTVVNAPTPTATPADPFATWKTYQVISGTTKLPIDGISYKLPADILAPVCDTTCMSQGTYLTGGTIFTVAPRGIGQLLVDFRGSAISDVGGAVFTTTDTTVGGHKAKLFTGSFSGKTAGGYGFNQMRGYMIEVTPTLSLEINHFTPNGATADFAADDTLFDKIVSTFVMPGTQSVTPVVTPPLSATSSGY